MLEKTGGAVLAPERGQVDEYMRFAGRIVDVSSRSHVPCPEILTSVLKALENGIDDLLHDS